MARLRLLLELNWIYRAIWDLKNNIGYSIHEHSILLYSFRPSDCQWGFIISPFESTLLLLDPLLVPIYLLVFIHMVTGTLKDYRYIRMLLIFWYAEIEISNHNSCDSYDNRCINLLGFSMKTIILLTNSNFIFSFTIIIPFNSFLALWHCLE